MRKPGTPQAVVVCEDRNQYHFVRGYLEALGIKRFDPDRKPAVRGDAKAFVYEEYAKELSACRAKHPRTVLVAVADADTNSVAERRALVEGDTSRFPDEEVLVIVPKRHIESWFEFVLTGAVDEDKKYKQKYMSRPKPKKWGTALAAKCRSSSPDEIGNWPPSLRDACDEIKRLKNR